MEGDPKTWFELVGSGGSFTLLALLLYWLTMKAQPRMDAMFDRAQSGYADALRQQQAANEKAAETQQVANEKLAMQFLEEKNRARQDFRDMLAAERLANQAQLEAHLRTMERVVTEMQRLGNLMLLLYSKTHGPLTTSELAAVGTASPPMPRSEQL